MKLTLAFATLVLSLSSSIYAVPLDARELAEPLEQRDVLPELALEERSVIGLEPEMTLASRDNDPDEELAARGGAASLLKGAFSLGKKALGAVSKAKPAAAAKSVAKAAPAVKKPPKVAPPAGAKGKAMDTHVQQQRAAKNAAKNAQRGTPFAGSKKEKKTIERKENRQLAKKQNWQAGAKAGKYKMGLNGKPVDKNTPVTKKEKQARTNRKAAGAAAHAKLTPTQKAAKANAQAAKAAGDASTKGARRAARVNAKDTARKSDKAARGKLMQGARADYKKSLDTKTFPGRKTKFTTPQGKEYNGRDVRQSLFNSHAAARKGGVGYESRNGKPSPANRMHPKAFENRANSNGKQPLPGMKGQGREFGMTSGTQKGYDGRSPNPTEARLITQENKKGAQEFQGVVAHPAGSDDHVKVRGKRFGIPLPKRLH